MSYSVHPNINTLTVLLMAHGVRHVVICPGSRNAPLAHNFAVCPGLTCHAVTDERSAGFQALGLCQALGEPVVVCVTSGTALLNLAPAVAEAAYQHLPLVVVSADRPQAWIDQLDGQTLPQQDALGRFIRKAVSLPEWNEALPDGLQEADLAGWESARQEALTRHWYCNRLINEALLAALRDGCGPVHINVPITPPLYQFQTDKLPEERKISFFSATTSTQEIPSCVQLLLEEISKACRPLIVIGQTKPAEIPSSVISTLKANDQVVLQEPLSGAAGSCGVDEMLCHVSEAEELLPDFILYVGGTLVSKRLKDYLRRSRLASCWRVDPEGTVADTFMNLHGVVQALPAAVLASITKRGNKSWADYWRALQTEALAHRQKYIPPFSSMLAVRLFELQLQLQDSTAEVHYANSMSVRLGCIYANHYIYCNRGVNGIEGSLSTAAGFSLATDHNVYCVIGDLSFFYDQNALWNQNLGGNLRILLLNNGGGGIFRKFPLQGEGADARLVMATHITSARGICEENHVEYHVARDPDSLNDGLSALTVKHAPRPVLLEVVTNGEADWQAYQSYFKQL